MKNAGEKVSATERGTREIWHRMPSCDRDMDMLIVQLPRGRTAVVRFDAATGRVTTDHPGLRATVVRNGVRDVSGQLVFPHAGREFLSALYDALFLSGYRVRWCGTMGGLDRPAASPG